MKDMLNIEFMPSNEAQTCGIYDNYPLAYSYVPYQKYENLYSREKAFQAGTAFPSLDKPLGVYGNEFSRMEGAKKLW